MIFMYFDMFAVWQLTGITTQWRGFSGFGILGVLRILGPDILSPFAMLLVIIFSFLKKSITWLTNLVLPNVGSGNMW